MTIACRPMLRSNTTSAWSGDDQTLTRLRKSSSDWCSEYSESIEGTIPQPPEWQWKWDTNRWRSRVHNRWGRSYCFVFRLWRGSDSKWLMTRNWRPLYSNIAVKWRNRIVHWFSWDFADFKKCWVSKKHRQLQVLSEFLSFVKARSEQKFVVWILNAIDNSFFKLFQPKLVCQ